MKRSFASVHAVSVRPTPFSSPPSRYASRRQGFTLIELLVVVVIIGIVAALLLPLVGSMRKQASMTKELSGGRQIMVAYLSYATAHDGELIKGYDKNVGDVSLPQGQTVSGIMCARYPWRLAEYISGQIDNVFIINDDRRRVTGLATDSFQYQYLASLYPAFGINAYCVGGYDDASGSGNFSSDCVTRLANATNAARLIVFASARYRENGTDTPGFHTVTPPKFWRTKWSTPYDQKKDPASYGNVDLRWNGKALCCFLDGHTELLGETELVDMRRWSRTAAENDDPNFFVPR